MNLNKCFLQFSIFLLFSGTCLASIINDTLRSKESSEIIEAASKVVKSCYRTREKAIVVAGKLPDSLITLLSSEESATVIVIDNSRRSVNSGPVAPMSRYKVQFFVVIASSSRELEEILVGIKKSPWWNHMANFNIINWPVNEHGCSRAYEILWTAWKMNLLDAKFMCTDRTKGRLIYTFNPYTRDAPDPWKLENTYKGVNDHPWTLLVRKYRDNNELCGSMDFDKTKDLGGYEIRVTTSELTLRILIDANKTGVYSLGGLDGSMAHSIFQSLNATIKLMHHPLTEPLRFTDDKGVTHGVLAETVNGISDIALIGVGLTNLTYTYPYYFTGYSIMTQYRGHESQLSKIGSVLDVSSRIGLCLVLLVTLTFLKYFVRQTRATAILNIIRIICNTGLTKLPGNVAARIYLTGLFIFVVTIQGTYHGKLAFVLSNQKPLKNLNTMSDLAESNYTIYAHYYFHNFFTDRAFDGRFVSIDNYNCTKYVLQDSSVACIFLRDVLLSQAAQFKLHLSSDIIIKEYRAFTIRDDWPLEQRLNFILQRLLEANMFHYTSNLNLEETFHTIAANDDEEKREGLKVFNLDDLGFAFAILGIGLSCAAISFIVEMIIGRGARAWIPKIRSRNLFGWINRRECFRFIRGQRVFGRLYT